MSKRSPCEDCPDRELYCHATCEQYREYTEKLKRRKQKEPTELTNYHIEKKTKKYKALRKKGVFK